jgi:CHAD domain-containing protein
MVDQAHEIERKYETPENGLPDPTRVPQVAAVVGKGTELLDATYYDTEGERLAADHITLRRRTGGDDAGWHLKLPVRPDVREEIRAPLSDELPQELAALVQSRVRGTPLVPLVRLRTERDLRHLLDADGTLLAELAVDKVTAERLSGGGGTAHWTEIEVELAVGTGPGFLDAVEEVLTQAGIRRAPGPSKLARALASTRTAGAQVAQKPPERKRRTEPTAGGYLLDYLRVQLRAIVVLDPAVRRDQPDSVHRMRVATRRLRSAFRTFRRLLDRGATDPLCDELAWLAGELGVYRDHEVLTARLYGMLDELPDSLLIGPVRSRLRTWSDAGLTNARRRAIAALDDKRYLDLLDALDALLAHPPLLPAAGRAPLEAFPDVVLREFDRLAGRVDAALAAPRGSERDIAMHEARKAAKRTRYAAEVVRPVIGKPAARFVEHMKALQDVLGDHQDSVVARGALRDLAVQAQEAGESGFALGVLYGREEARAAAREEELPRVWRKASRKKLRKALRAVKGASKTGS